MRSNRGRAAQAVLISLMAALLVAACAAGCKPKSGPGSPLDVSPPPIKAKMLSGDTAGTAGGGKAAPGPGAEAGKEAPAPAKGAK